MQLLNYDRTKGSNQDSQPTMGRPGRIAALGLAAALGVWTGAGRADETHFLTKMFFGWIYPIEFDASQCVTPANGKIHFALGDQVYRWPFDSATMFKKPQESSAPIGQPRPPDASQPQGCRDNPFPIRKIGFSVDPSGSTLMRNIPDRPSHAPDRPSVFVQLLFTPSTVRAPMDYEVLFAMTCEDSMMMTAEGFIRCSMLDNYDTGQKRKNQYRYHPRFKIPPTVYSNPTGGPIYIRCDDDPASCQVSYRLYAAVTLAYEFHRRAPAISKFIEFDKALRAFIEDAHISDYGWLN